MLDVCLWRSLFDNRPSHVRNWSFSTLCDALSKPRARPDDKKKLPLWSPTLFKAGAIRRKENVQVLSCLVLDHDDGETIESACKKWEKYTYILHTSYQHTDQAHRFRLVFPFQTPVDGKHWPAVWRWAEVMSGKTIDISCKNQDRLYFLPCVGEDFRFIVNEAKLLDLSHLRYNPPVLRIPPRLPGVVPDYDPSWREQVGLQAGGRRVSDRIRDIVCPKCGRKEVWWLINPESWKGACCNRRNSCGWAGGILQAIGAR